MSIEASLSSDGLEEMYTAPTLKDTCLYTCWKNKDILTKEMEPNKDEVATGKGWEKFRLKESVQKDLVEALLDAGGKFLFGLTPRYEPVLAAIRMSQPENLVKVHVNNAHTLEDHQLEFLMSGGNVKSLDIHECKSLKRGSLDVINKFGSKLEYLRIGNSSRILPKPRGFSQRMAILSTPNLKTFIISAIKCESRNSTNYWNFLLQDFISNLEDLQISKIEEFQTLKFLEPARNKLSSLSLRDCVVSENANAWASLFKLDKLRSLDVVGSLIEEALDGENVVERLLAAMPNLTHLAVDPGVIEDFHVGKSIRGQGSMAKRLEFLGILDNDEDEDEIGKAKLLANDVAYFGTVEGELRILEYYSNRLNISDFSLTLETLLESSSMMAPCKTVAVISLLMKVFKNNGVNVVLRELFFENFKKLFAVDVAAKLGEVLLDQCIGAIFDFLSRWSGKDPETEPEMISDAIDIMMNVDGELRFDHYVTVVPIVMSMAEKAMTNSILRHIDMEELKELLKKITQLLEKVVLRFPGETNELWGISSLLVVIKQLMKVVVSRESDGIDLMVIFSSMIASLKKLCLNSGPRRTAFHSAKGVRSVLELLKEIIGGSLGDRASFALLEFLKSTLEDKEFDLSESGVIASGLEKLFLSLHSRWGFPKSRETTYYCQLESIAGLLNFLENDPKYNYKAGAAVEEIMMKLLK